MSTLEIQTALLCEDIRQEKSNKFILIGVYAGEILVSALPTKIALCLYISALYDSNEGDGLLWVRLRGPGQGSATMKIGYKPAEDSKYLTLVTPVLEVALEEEGTLVIETSPDGESWSPMISREVSLREGLWSMISTVSPPPPAQSEPGALDSPSQP